jgi:hypothetical protein
MVENSAFGGELSGRATATGREVSAAALTEIKQSFVDVLGLQSAIAFLVGHLVPSTTTTAKVTVKNSQNIAHSAVYSICRGNFWSNKDYLSLESFGRQATNATIYRVICNSH